MGWLGWWMGQAGRGDRGGQRRRGEVQIQAI